MNLKFKKENFFFGINNSLLKNSWIKNKPDTRLSLNISQKYSLTNNIANILALRVNDINEIKNFLEPNLDYYLPDPTIFNDLKKAADRVFKAVKEKEKITIFGDYDVDGLSSIVLLRKFLGYFDIDTYSYIPDRLTEGYGPNFKAIDKIKEKKTSLLIMVDCGTNSHEIISYVKKNKMDLIIIDHHKSFEKHINFLTLINPNSVPDSSGYGFLCSTGLTFIFINYLQKLFKLKNFLSKKIPDINMFLDLVALATVCDVVPLIGLNRAFVFQGLKIFSKRQNIGLKILSDESQLNKKPDEEDLGFFFGPRINAGGRVGKANIGEKLLISEDENEAELLAKQLNTLNYQRKLIEEKVYDESIKQIIKNKKFKNHSLFIFSTNWHEGVLGIVASRIKEKYKKPVIILTKNKNIYKGSGRSILGIDIGLFILQAKQKEMIMNGGGHQMAAGLSIRENQLKVFEVFFEDFVKNNKNINTNTKNLNIDEVLTLGAINDDLIDNLNKIAPYGLGNPKPKFLFYNVKIIKPKIIGETKKHLSFFVIDETNKAIKAIIFNGLDNELGKTIISCYKKNLFSFIGFIKRSIWKNKTYFEIIIEDGVLGKVII